MDIFHNAPSYGDARLPLRAADTSGDTSGDACWNINADNCWLMRDTALLSMPVKPRALISSSCRSYKRCQRLGDGSHPAQNRQSVSAEWH